jgi:hypothetical protein
MDEIVRELFVESPRGVSKREPYPLRYVSSSECDGVKQDCERLGLPIEFRIPRASINHSQPSELWLYGRIGRAKGSDFLEDLLAPLRQQLTGKFLSKVS